ncbi:UNVERIFIED_CONTAM: hypothetical protein Sangu_1005900 [Sesamum angustifolium]|uniref:DUF7032 domain-containing protein n=1 Tax=Sesamum angustifolium TaxID=2727405 RepID=A0AAW2PHZ2_9LAMI
MASSSLQACFPQIPLVRNLGFPSLVRKPSFAATSSGLALHPPPSGDPLPALLRRVFSRGKLLMQSDLDMAAGWLSKQINDLELLLRSGVLHQSTAIVLSRPNPSSSKEELTFFIKDLFTRLQIGGLEFKRKGLESLIQLLSDDDKSAALVAKEGNVSCLISLLDLNAHDSLRELAVHAVSLLVSSGDLPRKIVFEEGALGPC